MSSNLGDYTPPKAPDGYVEAENELGEKVWRLAELEARLQSRTHWKHEGFLLLKLSGLSSVLGISPRINVVALAILLFAVQRDRIGRQPLTISQELIAKIGSNRKSIYRGVDWLEANLPRLVIVSRATGKAHRVKLTEAGRRAFHPIGASP